MFLRNYYYNFCSRLDLQIVHISVLKRTVYTLGPVYIFDHAIVYDRGHSINFVNLDLLTFFECAHKEYNPIECAHKDYNPIKCAHNTYIAIDCAHDKYNPINCAHNTYNAMNCAYNMYNVMNCVHDSYNAINC